MRVWHYVVVVFIVLFFGWYSQAENSMHYGHAMRQALAATGAELRESSVNGWAQLPSAALSDEELSALATNAVAKADFRAAEVALVSDAGPHHRLVRAEGKRDGLHAVAIAQVLYPRRENAAPEAYLVVNVEAVDSPEMVEKQRQAVLEAFKAAGSTPHVTTCLVGQLNGKLEREQMQGRLRKAFLILEASIDEGVTGRDFASYAGFTPRLPETLTVGNRLVNINMAMRYSSYDDRTYVMIGSPVITREY